MEQNYSEIWKKLVAGAAGMPVDLANFFVTPVVNTARKFNAIRKHEPLPKNEEEYIHTGSSKDIRERAGVKSEDTVLDILLQMLSPVPGSGAKAAASTPAIMAAFRRADNSSIGRAAIAELKKGLEPPTNNNIGLDSYAEWGRPNTSAAEDIVLQAVAGKVSDKEMRKYGTPEFILDKYLPSTRSNRTTPPGSIRPIRLEDFLEDSAAGKIRDYNAERAATPEGELRASLQYWPGMPEDLRTKPTTADDFYKDMILSEASKVEDLVRARMDNKTLYDTTRLRGNGDPALQREMSGAIRNTVEKARELGIPEEYIAKTPLHNLVSKIQQEEDKALAILKKSQELGEQNMTKREKELFEKQKGLYPEGIVHLETPLDLSHETKKMKHCVGASCSDGGEYQPAHNLVTGELSDQYQKLKAKYPDEVTSFDKYSKHQEEGDMFFSYRGAENPRDRFTTNLRRNTDGSMTVINAYGPQDADLTPKAKEKLDELVRQFGAKRDEGQSIDDGIDDIVGMLRARNNVNRQPGYGIVEEYRNPRGEWVQVDDLGMYHRNEQEARDTMALIERPAGDGDPGIEYRYNIREFPDIDFIDP